MNAHVAAIDNSQRGLIILGVTESDAHVVANQLIAHYLRDNGYEVLNLGACTSVEEFADACTQHPRVLAVVIGTANGHAFEDLRALRKAKDQLAIPCPVILGGNLWVGLDKPVDIEPRLRALGVDRILEHPRDLLTTLRELPRRNAGAERASVTSETTIRFTAWKPEKGSL